jgi:hypothetical protein
MKEILYVNRRKEEYETEMSRKLEKWGRQTKRYYLSHFTFKIIQSFCVSVE